MAEFAAAQPHGEIEALGEGVYWVMGSATMGPGMRIPRNMVIVRTGDALTLIHAVRLSERGERALEALGRVEHVVKIGYVHDLDDPYYIDRYGAKYWTLPNGTRKGKLAGTETLHADHLPFPDAQLVSFGHTKYPEAVLLVERDGGILVTCDSVQHWPNTRGCSLPAKLAAHAMGFRKRPAQIGPPWRKAMTPEGGSLREDFERIAELDFKHLVGAHGSPLRDTARDALEATIRATFA